jgi:hypothetical protein
MVMSIRRRPIFNPPRFVFTTTKGGAVKKGVELPGCAFMTYGRRPRVK